MVRKPAYPYLLHAFPEGDKLLIGHSWHAWRPKGDMTCLPCLSPRRIEELCRSSTFSRTAVVVMRCWLRTPVELLQSSYTYDTMVRQGSRFAPTLPYQAFNPFGVGELWEDIWRVLQRRMAWKNRNYHPAHFDNTDHRFAMGGYHGNLPPLPPACFPRRG